MEHLVKIYYRRIEILDKLIYKTTNNRLNEFSGKKTNKIKMIGTQSISNVAYSNTALYPFGNDNTGRNHTYNAATSVLTTGTYSFYPTADTEYRNFTAPLTGTLNILVGTASPRPYVNDEFVFTLYGGSATQSVILGNQLTAATSKTITVSANQYVKITGHYNGNIYICGVVNGI